MISYGWVIAVALAAVGAVVYVAWRMTRPQPGRHVQAHALDAGYQPSPAAYQAMGSMCLDAERVTSGNFAFRLRFPVELDPEECWAQPADAVVLDRAALEPVPGYLPDEGSDWTAGLLEQLRAAPTALDAAPVPAAAVVPELERLADTGDLTAAVMAADVGAQLRDQDHDTTEFMSQLASDSAEFRLSLFKEMT